MAPIAKEFNVPLTDVAIVFTLTLWMRLVGATASGWMADRMGRKKPLMISIAWLLGVQFHCRVLADILVLLLFRALLGIVMGAEWPCRRRTGDGEWPHALARLYERRVAGLLGSRLPAVERVLWLLFERFGWRGMLWVGIAPALAIVYIRYFVKEPEFGSRTSRLQQAPKRVVKVPLAARSSRRGMHRQQC